MLFQRALLADEFGAEILLGRQDQLILGGEQLFVSVENRVVDDRLVFADGQGQRREGWRRQANGGVDFLPVLNTPAAYGDGKRQPDIRREGQR